MLETSKTMLKASGILLVVILLIKLSLVFLWPFLFSLIIVLIMEPTVRLFISKGMKRNISVTITFIIYSIIVIVFIVYLWNYIGDRVISLSEIIPNLIEKYKDIPILTTLSENYERILLEVKNIVMEYKEKILETIVSTFSGVVYFFIILITSLLISIDLEYLSKSLLSIVGERIYNPIKIAIKSISKLITIEIKLVSLTTIITTISFLLLGFDDSLSIGILCGILDLLPVVGPIFLFLPIAIYLLTTKQIFIGVGVIFTCLLIMIVRQVMEIKLLQGNLILKPIFVIFSLYLGVILFGGIGVLFGPVILIIFKEIYKSLEKGDLARI